MVSIVIPAYNAARYLAESLDSVMAQDISCWEAIVVDDGSTDSTLAIARSYADRNSRIRVFSKENGGLSDARNFGTARAGGEWITFLDSDDCLCRGALRTLLNCAGNADIVAGSLISGSVFSAAPAPADFSSRTIPPAEALRLGLYQSSFQLSACAKLYRRGLLDRTRFTKGIWYEDLDFLPRVLLEATEVAVTDAPVYFYRDNPSSFIHTFSPGRLDVLTVTERIEKLVAARCPALIPAARDRRLSANFNIHALLGADATGRAAYAGVRDGCWELICSYRAASLRDPEVRLKNKLGILLSYLGPRVFTLISRLIYRN